jgi:hypothetical protein
LVAIAGRLEKMAVAITVRKELEQFFITSQTWGLSNTMTAEWCKQVGEEVMESYDNPEILNTDQGSQFTSEVFTGLLKGISPTPTLSI